MENKDNLQNGQGNYQQVNNAPNNPYTQYYREYIVEPGTAANEVSKPKRVASIFLCALSSMVLFSFVVMYTVFFYQIYMDPSSEMTVEKCLSFSVLFFLYLSPGFLVTAIIAKVINRKSTWALFNIILICVIFVLLIVGSFLLPLWSQGLADAKRSKVEEFSDAWNDGVEDLLDKYEFDVEDMNEDYFFEDGISYDVWVYVSSEATDKQLSDVNKFLEELYDLDDDLYKYDYQLYFKVHPVYYEPGDDSSFVFGHTNNIWPGSATRGAARINVNLDSVFLYAPRETSHVPERLEQGDLLIVVR